MSVDIRTLFWRYCRKEAGTASEYPAGGGSGADIKQQEMEVQQRHCSRDILRDTWRAGVNDRIG